jgi:hypothetical protein
MEAHGAMVALLAVRMAQTVPVAAGGAALGGVVRALTGAASSLGE